MKEEEIKELNAYMGEMWDAAENQWFCHPKKRRGGETAATMAAVEKLRAEGHAVLVIGPDTPRPPLLGAAMPPLEDVELNRALDYAAEHGMACLKARRGGPMPFFPHYPSMPDAFGQNGEMYNFKTGHNQLGITPDLLKAAEARDTPQKTKHNPKPSRMKFLDGLGRKKKF